MAAESKCRMIRFVTSWIARRQLARVVRQTRNSFECQDFRRRREAMLKVTRAES